MIRNFAGTAKGSAASAVRPNSEPENLKITDAELLTIYFYCRIHENRHSKTHIHDYAQRYLSSWFLRLPNHANFNTRLNAMDSAIIALVPIILQSTERQHNGQRLSELITLTDSMPILLCPGRRQGRVASELSDKGYCASKDLYYYGVNRTADAAACGCTPCRGQHSACADGRDNACIA